MGSPIANMLLAQAAPAMPNKPVGEMTNEELAQYRSSLGLQPAAPEPTPAPTPAPGYLQGILNAIGNAVGLGPSPAPTPQPTPLPLTPEQLAERNRKIAHYVGGQPQQ